METDAARIAKGSTYIATQRLATTVIGAIAFTLIARTLTKMEMGITVALSLTLSIAQLLSDLGFSRGLTKHIAEYRGRDADYSPILFSGLLVKTSTASVLAIFCAVVAPQLSQVLLGSDKYAILFQLLSIHVLSTCIYTTLDSFFLGLNKIRQMAILNVTDAIITQISAVALLIHGFGLIGLIVGWIIGDLAYIIVSVSILIKGRHIGKHSLKRIGQFLMMLAKFSWPLFLANIVAFIYNWFDRVILLTYIPLIEVAVYSVALQAFSVIYIMPRALSITLFPYYSEQYGRNRQDSVLVGVHATTRYIALLYTPLALGLVATARPVITLFAGSVYAKGDVILGILSLLGGISSMIVAFGGLLLVFNMTRTVLFINIASLGVSMVMLPFLLPSLGAPGMAIAKGVGMIMSLVLTIVALRKRMPIKIDKAAVWKSWCAAIIMFVVVSLIEYMYFSRYLLPLYILVGGITYVIALRILKAVDESDMKLFRNLAGKRATPLVDILGKILT